MMEGRFRCTGWVEQALGWGGGMVASSAFELPPFFSSYWWTWVPSRESVRD